MTIKASKKSHRFDMAKTMLFYPCDTICENQSATFMTIKLPYGKFMH